MIRPAPGGSEISVRVTPGAKRNEILGWAEGVLRVKIAAPPVDGAANAELVRFLARDVLKVPRSAVRIVRGEKGRDKTVQVDVAPSTLEGALRSRPADP